MNKQKLILVSIDALIYEDLAYLAAKPNFGRCMENGAMVKMVRSVYPTLTYPCHAAMATGCWPGKHGVLNNYHMTPGVESPHWVWYHDAYHVRDLLDAAKEKGLTTAAIGWPTMGCHPNADWIVAEVAGTTAKTDKDFYNDYRATGTTAALWEQVVAPHIHQRLRKKDARNVTMFNLRTCCEIVRQFQPDLTLLHLGVVDSYRHECGVFGPRLQEALDLTEQAVSEILQAVRDAGTEEITNIVLTADHGQMDAIQESHPNVLLAQHGFIETDETGAVSDWLAWSHSAGMCSTIHVRHKEDEAAVYALLHDNVNKYGWSRVYTREEIAHEGYDGNFSFVLETDNISKVGNNWLGDILVPYGKTVGGHGYHPDKGPCPPIVAVGPAFRKGAVLEKANLIDGAPTWAAILGLDLPDADGRVLTELLK